MTTEPKTVSAEQLQYLIDTTQHRDTYQRAFLELQSLRRAPAGSFAVRKLEWAKHPAAELWRAFCILGQYQVSAISEISWRFDADGGQQAEGSSSSIDGAFAAAQADYASRITSAIEAVPVSVTRKYPSPGVYDGIVVGAKFESSGITTLPGGGYTFMSQEEYDATFPPVEAAAIQPDSDREGVTREDAIKFLETACRNWSEVPKLSEEDIADVASELLRFRSLKASGAE